MAIINFIKRIFKLPRIEIWFFLRGFILVHFFDLSIKLLTLKTIALLISNPTYKLIKNNQQTYLKQLIPITARRIYKFSLWNIDCLAKAMMIKNLYNSINTKSRLILCLKKSDALKLEAHAYIELDDNIVFMKKQNFIDIYAIE